MFNISNFIYGLILLSSENKINSKFKDPITFQVKWRDEYIKKNSEEFLELEKIVIDFFEPRFGKIYLDRVRPFSDKSSDKRKRRDTEDSVIYAFLAAKVDAEKAQNAPNFREVIAGKFDFT